ncbi:hypothetical protein MU516_18190 [Paracoccus sp. YLB-12]|uniref:MarR family transcriptional regulator n=1 Tax=Paracoccus maritimus TaxID=2933292 RepID=A0ABT2KDZ4_9RHOB|nr:hypothetical protein [Paracoccus sp. YLB-12]MCT4334773.1 hypothetical protein [Paracoccus sp. YLB-12]
MSQAILEQDDVRAWVRQFSSGDQIEAAKLLALVKLVPSDFFRSEYISLLSRRLSAGEQPVGLFNESERRMWKGKPNRLFKEKIRANPNVKGKKIARAFGKVGPDLVPRQRNIDEEVGSEGILANILTQFARSNRKVALLSPGPDRFRDEGVRRFILCTDFIGSGERIERYINAAWRLGSIRSWWSRRNNRGIHFEVLAFSGTEDGIARIERHVCRPKVHVVTQCPTIRTVFPPAQAAIIESLCKRYSPDSSRSLGFGETGALLAFGHGMPNNAPAIFWKSSRRWQALFPERATISPSSPFIAVPSEVQERERLELLAETTTIGPTVIPVDIETIVLATLRRSPRHAEAVSGRLGLDLLTVQSAFVRLRKRGWINEFQQLTDRGRLVVRRLSRFDAKISLSNHNEQPYFPKSLRMPRDV